MTDAPATRACPLCGSPDAVEDALLTRVVRAEPPERIVRCLGCTLVRRDPPLSDDRLGETYDDAYYEQYAQTVGMTGDLGGAVRPHLCDRLRTVEARTGVGRLLEIGCAQGYFLDHARSAGWQTMGVEVSASAGEEARGKGLDVHIGPVDSMPVPAEPVDFVHMNHVLEHLVDPVGALRKVGDMLAPTGLAVIEVPNEFDNLFFRLGRLALPERSLIYPVRSTHQVFFNPSTLRRTVEAAGLAVERCRTIRWTIGDRSGPVGRVLRRAVYLLERPLGCAGNVEVVATPGA